MARRADLPGRAQRAIDASIRSYQAGEGALAIAAALRGLTWAVLHAAEQLKRQADFWHSGGDPPGG